MKQQLQFRLVLLLGAFALIRPILRLTGVAGNEGPLNPAVASVGATVLITLVWIFAVIQSRTARPVLTLALAGVTYALLSSTLAAVLSPILDGELQGPLTNPFALVSVLIVNAAWGAISGCLAWVIASAREHSSR